MTTNLPSPETLPFNGSDTSSPWSGTTTTPTTGFYGTAPGSSGPYTGIIIAIVSSLAVICLSMTLLFILRVAFVANRRRRLQEFQATYTPPARRTTGSASDLTLNNATSLPSDVETNTTNPTAATVTPYHNNPDNIDPSLPSPPPKIPIIIIQPDGKSDFAVKDSSNSSSTGRSDDASSSLPATTGGPPTSPRTTLFPYQPGSMTRGRWIRGRWYPYRPPKPPAPLVTVEYDAAVEGQEQLVFEGEASSSASPP